MIVEVDKSGYFGFFPQGSNPFVSEGFIDLNKCKTERVVYLVDNSAKPLIGLVAGINDESLASPFSAPFGGFHFLSENIYISEIEKFLKSIQEYIVAEQLKGISIILPPDIYHASFNSKMTNSLLRIGFCNKIPELTNWVDLNNFNGILSHKSSMEFYRQAARKGLNFTIVNDIAEKTEVFDLIYKNRINFGRLMPMSLKKIEETEKLWPVDFYKVTPQDGIPVASAIFYRCHPTICYAAYWGDNVALRSLRGMDYMVYNLYDHYKSMGYRYIDLGISSRNGLPNEGLLRFKECHNSISSLRFEFFWKNEYL